MATFISWNVSYVKIDRYATSTSTPTGHPAVSKLKPVVPARIHTAFAASTPDETHGGACMHAHHRLGPAKTAGSRRPFKAR